MEGGQLILKRLSCGVSLPKIERGKSVRVPFSETRLFECAGVWFEIYQLYRYASDMVKEIE